MISRLSLLLVSPAFGHRRSECGDAQKVMHEVCLLLRTASWLEDASYEAADMISMGGMVHVTSCNWQWQM